jgi:2-phosphosulfolactate phosphatase
MQVRFVDLAHAVPDEVVVVIDVLRAFTTVPWFHERGAREVLAVATAATAFALRDELVATRPGRVVLAGEDGGQRLEGFHLGNSPTEVAGADLEGATIVHRTSAGTQGLARCAGSGRLFAASFVNAAATVTAVRATGGEQVTFVVTGASLGRDGDEDLACAELLAARLRGVDPDPQPFLDRVPTSDAGRAFGPGGPDWAPASDLARALELDRFDRPLVVVSADHHVPAVRVGTSALGRPG